MKTLAALLLSYGMLTACSNVEACEVRGKPKAKHVVMPAEVAENVILKGTIASLIRNPFTGTHKGITMVRSRGETLVDPLLNRLPPVDAAYRKSNSVEDMLDVVGVSAPVPGNVEYLIGGKAFFTDITTSIEEAKESVDTRVYIFDNDDVAVEFADLLKRKAKTLKCRVLMDELGSIAARWEEPPT